MLSSIDNQLFRFALNLTSSASFNPNSWTRQWLTSSICEWCFGINLTFTLMHLPDEWLDNVYRNIIIILISCDWPFVNIISKGQVCNLAFTIYYLETFVRFVCALKNCNVWAYKTATFYESACIKSSSQERERSCICVFGVSTLTLATILIFDFVIVPTVWDFSFYVY